MSAKKQPEPKIILLSGKKMTGKSTLVNYLLTRYPNSAELTLAGPIKDFCKSLFVLSEDQLYNQQTKEIKDSWWNTTPRTMFQKTGDMIRENIGDVITIGDSTNIFILSLIKKICDNPIYKNLSYIFVSDVRYENEHNQLKKTFNKNCISIRINRDTGNTDTHSSELLDFKCDYTINNDKSIETLYESAELIMMLISDPINL